MPKTIDKYVERVGFILQDAVGALGDGDRLALTRQAITQRYSKDRPREIVTDTAGDGTSDLALPAETGQNGVAFEEGFSEIRQIEYPIGSVTPALLEDDEWMMYRSPGGLKVRLLAERPEASESVRFTWTSRHKEDASTVLDADFDAVCDCAASLCFMALAAAKTQTGDATIGADVVNYRSKSQEYTALAREAWKRYAMHVGVPLNDGQAGQQSGGGAVPAMALGEVDLPMGWGGDRITHGSKTR